MITAHACDVRCSPGRYQIATVLRGLIHRSRRDRREYQRARYHAKRNGQALRPYHRRSTQAEREQAMRAIYALPDDERELWSRVPMS